MTTKCLVFSLWSQLFVGFVLWNFIKCVDIEDYKPCLDRKGKEVAPGDRFIPLETDPCTQCFCLNGKPQMCIAVFCSPPINCRQYHALSDKCCEFVCLDRDVNNKTSGNGTYPGKDALQCSAPPSIFDGNYTLTAQDKITIGTQAIYSCIPGYELSDPSVSSLTCILNEDGNGTLWAGDIPACQVIKPCSDPGISMDGTREGACCLPGNIVSYSCNEGFEMVGEKDIECLLSKRWSSPRPLCKPLKKKHCELPPEIPNGVVLMKLGDYALAYEEAEILCKPAYKLNGTNQYPYCNGSALWEDEFGECVEIICDRPEPLVNGNIPELEKSNFTESFPNNFLLTYDCDEGYRLNGGDSWRVCLKEGWSGTTPYCEEIFCPYPGAPEHGTRQGNSFKVGAKVIFSCFAGYELLGSYERYCTPNGKWTGELTRCNAPTNYCPNPGIPINGMREGHSYNEGDTVEFSCASGFIHSGSKRRTCRVDRTWSGTETKCLGTHDFDSTEKIGRILKQRLHDQFDEKIREYELIRMPAHGKVENKMLDFPPRSRLIVYFAFDVSGSIGKVNFKKGIEFAKDIVRKIEVKEDGARAGALIFSNEAVNIFFPMQFKTTEEVLVQLDNIEYLGGGTATTSALQGVINNIKLIENQEEFKDTELKHVLFLITDGKSNMGGSPEYEAEFLKDKMKVEIFCIGITGDVRADAMYKIASTSKYGDEERPNVFLLKNYERLNWLIQDIAYGTLDYGQCGLGMESKMTSNQGKMIGGKRSVEYWPWMATLFFSDPKKKAARPELKCGGSIINENFILTAAQCLFERDIKTLEYRKRSAEEIIVKLGVVELRNQILFQDFEVENLYIHNDYMPGDTYDNDIALLKLNRPIIYDPFTRPVCLPPADLPEDDNYPLYKPNEYGWVTGFGHEYQGKIYDKYEHFMLPKEINELRLPIQPHATCSSSLGKQEKYFTERMFCAGDEKAGKGTCKGDSGGPFMQPHMNSQGQVYWTQVGLVSWGIGCGNKGHYGYYTKVQLFRPWIDEKMKEIVSKEGEE